MDTLNVGLAADCKRGGVMSDRNNLSETIDLQKMAGSLGTASVRMSKHGRLIYTVSCRSCKGMAGQTYRSGHENTRWAALSRWVLHLDWGHSDALAPCLAMLDDAKAQKAEQKAKAAAEL